MSEKSEFEVLETEIAQLKKVIFEYNEIFDKYNPSISRMPEKITIQETESSPLKLQILAKVDEFKTEIDKINRLVNTIH